MRPKRQEKPPRNKKGPTTDVENPVEVKMGSGKIACSLKELDLGITLKGGQSFRWTETRKERIYRGVFAGRVWTLEQDERHLTYLVHGPLGKDPKNERILSKYLRLEVSLEENLKKWKASDPHFQKACDKVEGVRILNQDVVENLFSFICSSNNNIIRISSMVEKMCTFFGKKLCRVDGEDYYDFPTIDSLAESQVESTLREAGFGYRAAYIANTARELKDSRGLEWLRSLHKDSNESYEIARAKLTTLPGVGPKVADCVCLMSLGHLEAIPVDTHIFQVARDNYMPQLGIQKTVTPKIHHEVSTHLRELWGPLAGWAQAVVFCAKINNNVALPKKQKPNGSVDKKMNNANKQKRRGTVEVKEANDLAKSRRKR